MRSIATLTVCAALVLAASSSAFAQAAATPVPAQPSGPPAAPALFPADAKVAFIDFRRVATTSIAGRLALRMLQELQNKKVSDIDVQNKQFQALMTRRDSGVLSGPALAQLSKDMDKLQREIQFAQQNAQAELQQMETELQADLHTRMTPVVADIAKEKGVYAVLTAESGVFYLHPGLDISAEVVRRLDAQPKK
jgi:Skp family chaperone for outer membrane proteins